MYFLVNASPLQPKDVATSNFDTEGTLKVKGQIIYFLVNTSPKQLGVAISDFAGV